MQPLLSLIIPVYNGRTFLREAVLSVLREGIPSLEILIVDDGSTDGSLESVEDLEVKTIQLEKNQGQAAAQNVGVANAQGKFIVFLDSDDLLSRGGLLWRLEWMLRSPEAPLVAGRIAGIIDGNGKKIGSYKNVLNPGYRTPPSPISLTYLKSGGEFPSQVWNLIFRKEFLFQVGPFDESLKCAHDNDFLHRILKVVDIPFENRPTVFYRIHENNLSGSLVADGFHYRRIALAENLLVHLSHGIPPRN